MFCFHSRSASFSIFSPAIIWGRRASASRREMMAVAGIVATSLLGISWAPSPARWGHHHSGITSRGPGGGPSVSHHAAARALEGPDGAPVPGPPGSGHHWHRGRPRCWRAAAAVAPGRGLGGGGTTVQPSAVHRRCSRVRCRLDQDLCETTLRHLPRTCTQHKSFRLKFPKRESMWALQNRLS